MYANTKKYHHTLLGEDVMNLIFDFAFDMEQIDKHSTENITKQKFVHSYESLSRFDLQKIGLSKKPLKTFFSRLNEIENLINQLDQGMVRFLVNNANLWSDNPYLFLRICTNTKKAVFFIELAEKILHIRQLITDLGYYELKINNFGLTTSVQWEAAFFLNYWMKHPTLYKIKPKRFTYKGSLLQKIKSKCLEDPLVFDDWEAKHDSYNHVSYWLMTYEFQKLVTFQSTITNLLGL